MDLVILVQVKLQIMVMMIQVLKLVSYLKLKVIQLV